MKRRMGAYLQLVLMSAFALAQVAPGTKHMVGSEPPLGVLTSKDVGEVIYSKFDYTATTGVRLLDSFQARELLRDVVVPAGTFLKATSARESVNLCSNENAVSGVQPGEVVCFRDVNQDGRLEQLHIPGTRFGAYKTIKGAGPRYEEGVDLDSTVGFRRELLYDGVSSGVIRLGYREFVNSLARPAFQQELTYTLESGGPTEVAFRGARIRVHSATNQQIHYEVVAGLRE